MCVILYLSLWGKGLLSREKSKYYGPEAEMSLEHLSNSKKPQVSKCREWVGSKDREIG